MFIFMDDMVMRKEGVLHFSSCGVKMFTEVARPCFQEEGETQI